MAFSQAPWLAPYINFNTKMRQQATSEFQKNLWKLKNNSVFGKTCENVKKRRSVSFTREKSKFLKLVRSPLFHSFEILEHDMIIVERHKPNVVLNRPLYVGAVVLDVSKQIMFNFHYNAIKKMYKDKVTMCASDTDSLFYHIETDDVYKDMQGMSKWLDTSDYPLDHPLYSLKNKKVMGLFKDENNGKIMTSFIGLRAKMYTFSTVDGKTKCVGKGVPRQALKQQLSFKDYYKCIVEKKNKNVSFKKISSDRKHNLFTTFSTKKGLSCFDDKRYIESCNVKTKAYGHFSIRDDGERNISELVELLDEL
ncbi:uncharacterized protein LOC117650747 [Thrips palmi]|uniref:Uncharacterized protein LOC117650747 n=1 Tax=Thrips palmi TaxID=161013 RepID=A0A6P8ZZV2_THRPL|nr:uncharacterized protein LOC117650747 [Thrips palmi]